jgi:hypothetical protein
LAEKNAIQERKDTNLKKIKSETRNNREEMRTDQGKARLEAKEANNENYEVLRGTLFSWIHTH